MREILQWTTLIVCAAATLARIPSALRGTNRSLFFIFLLATAAGVLSLDVFYFPIDRALGGINIASLLLRLIVFAAIYLVAFRVSRAFGARDAYALISGRIGLGVLGLFSAALVTLFLLMDISASSPGLADAVSLERLVVNNSAVLFFASGLVMVWLARVRAQRMGGTRNVMY